jgi:hypothetical protein
MKLLPVEKLALEVGGWGVLALLAFFFHEAGFTIIFLIAAYNLLMFMFVHENTKDVIHDSDPTEPKQHTEQLYLPGLSPAELGTNGEGSVRTNLPASNAERRTGDLG